MSDYEKADTATAARLASEPDAHGQAALLLAESTLHELVDNKTLTVGAAVRVVRNAAEVKVEVATFAHESKQRMNESLELLQRIAVSLETDGAVMPDRKPAMGRA